MQHRTALLADEMGLGKTVQASVAINKLFLQDAIRRVLVICPSSLTRNWRQELRKWCSQFPPVIYEGGDRYGMLFGQARILIGSYETISADLKRISNNGKDFFDIGVDLIILDEAQRIKDSSSIKSRILSKLLAARRWAITGTPLENHPRELASILRFLYPNELGMEHDVQNNILILALKDRCMLRRTKTQVNIQLPPKIEAHVPIILTPSQAAEYSHVCSQIRQSILGSSSLSCVRSNLIAGLQKLRRISTISSSGDSAKIDFIAEEMEKISENGEKAVVFSSFPNLIRTQIADRFRKYGVLFYDGSMNIQQKEKTHFQFMNETSSQLMCASIRAAGVGLTWTVASHVYHLDMWWNPQVLRQAEDRVHRIGQKKHVLVKRLFAENTLDCGILKLLESKEDIFAFVIDNRIDDNLKSIAIEDMLSLIGLRLNELSGIK